MCVCVIHVAVDKFPEKEKMVVLNNTSCLFVCIADCERQNLLLLSALLWEKNSVDVWQNTSLGNGHTGQELAQLLVVSHSKLNVPWHNSGLLVVTGSVTGKLENLSSQVLEDGSKVHWGTSSDSLGIASLLEVPGNTTNWELKPSLG